MKKKLDLEEEYANLEAELPEQDYPEPVDNLSTMYCAHCGARMTRVEWEEYEDSCEECVWNDTSGLIDDDPEAEIE